MKTLITHDLCKENKWKKWVDIFAKKSWEIANFELGNPKPSEFHVQLYTNFYNKS